MGEMQQSTNEMRICVPGNTAELQRVRSFVASKARKSGFSEQGVYNLTLAVDEACSNVIRHAYRHDNSREFCVEIDLEQGQFIVKIFDSGSAFNPLSISAPAMKEYFEKFMRGGLGISIIKKVIDNIEYIPADAKHPFNILKLIKTLDDRSI